MAPSGRCLQIGWVLRGPSPFLSPPNRSSLPDAFSYTITNWPNFNVTSPPPLTPVADQYEDLFVSDFETRSCQILTARLYPFLLSPVTLDITCILQVRLCSWPWERVHCRDTSSCIQFNKQNMASFVPGGTGEGRVGYLRTNINYYCLLQWISDDHIRWINSGYFGGNSAVNRASMLRLKLWFIHGPSWTAWHMIAEEINEDARICKGQGIRWKLLRENNQSKYKYTSSNIPQYRESLKVLSNTMNIV